MSERCTLCATMTLRYVCMQKSLVFSTPADRESYCLVIESGGGGFP